MTDEKTPGMNGADDHIADAAPGDEAADIGTANIDRLLAEAAEWRDKALRAAAEAENTRRRAEREMNDARAYAIQRFAKDLLDAADNLERALKAAPREDPQAAGFITGVELTEKALQNAFERNGLKKLEPARGEKFDPHLHQAMMEQPADDVPAGAVVQTMQTGYELFGRIVRPAMVIVAAKGAATESAAGGYGQAGAAGESGGAIDTRA